MGTLSRSNWKLEMLVFEERGTPKKNLTEQGLVLPLPYQLMNHRLEPNVSLLIFPQAAGKYKQEGKNYVVNDGDIIFFKFNAGAGLTDKKKAK